MENTIVVDAKGNAIEVGMYAASADMSICDDFLDLGRGPVLGRITEISIEEGVCQIAIDDGNTYLPDEIIALPRGMGNTYGP